MGPPSSPNAACCAPRTPSRCVRWKLPADSDSPSPITGAALGVGYGDDKNGVGFLLKDHGIGKPRQYASASVLCIDGIELRMRNNLRQRCPDFSQESVGRFRAALEIPFKRFVDLLLSLRYLFDILI